MKVIVHYVEGWQKNVLWEARQKVGWSTENFFHEAANYFRESIRMNSKQVQALFVAYFKSGGTDIPEFVTDFALDILAGRVTPE